MDMQNSIDIEAHMGKLFNSTFGHLGLSLMTRNPFGNLYKKITWLGLTWNEMLGTIEIAPHRVTKLLSTLREVLRQEKISAQNLQSRTKHLRHLLNF